MASHPQHPASIPEDAAHFPDPPEPAALSTCFLEDVFPERWGLDLGSENSGGHSGGMANRAGNIFVQSEFIANPFVDCITSPGFGQADLATMGATQAWFDGLTDAQKASLQADSTGGLECLQQGVARLKAEQAVAAQTGLVLQQPARYLDQQQQQQQQQQQFGLQLLPEQQGQPPRMPGSGASFPQILQDDQQDNEASRAHRASMRLRTRTKLAMYTEDENLSPDGDLGMHDWQRGSSEENDDDSGSPPRRNAQAGDGGSDDSGARPARGQTRRGNGAGRRSKAVGRSTVPTSQQERNRLAQRRFQERRKAKLMELENRLKDLSRANKQLASEKQELEQRLASLQLQSGSNDPHSQTNSGGSPLPPIPVADLEDAVVLMTLTVRQEQPMQLTKDQVKHFSSRELGRVWREYVNQLAACLVTMETKPPQEAGGLGAERDGTLHQQDAVVERVVTLTSEAVELFQVFSRINPIVVKEFVANRIEETQLLADEERCDMWLHIARSLNLSHSQKQHLVRLRRMFLDHWSRITDHRRKIKARLASEQQVTVRGRHSAQQQVQTHESIEQLKKNYSEENLLFREFIAAFNNQVLSPMQMARCIVQSYPWYPDTLAILTWVAADVGDADALALLNATYANGTDKGSLSSAQDKLDGVGMAPGPGQQLPSASAAMAVTDMSAPVLISSPLGSLGAGSQHLGSPAQQHLYASAAPGQGTLAAAASMPVPITQRPGGHYLHPAASYSPAESALQQSLSQSWPNASPGMLLGTTRIGAPPSEGMGSYQSSYPSSHQSSQSNFTGSMPPPSTLY
ncbi:hypothetical protein WJX72_009354 [[Myrmecia] bisecta]|uniref:BZIP domain-containing protein n=1 Tax=[Myrmecia] bisecta TaxID=41462 RepID=A0AAW1R8D3_9CHLO